MEDALRQLYVLDAIDINGNITGGCYYSRVLDAKAVGRLCAWHF